MNYRQIKAIEAANKKRILEVCPDCPERPGIYAFYRLDETGIRFAYLGQARSLLSRSSQHLSEYDHIALSLKKRGFYNAETNPYGWCFRYWEYSLDDLDAMEQDFIKRWADMGYQLFNRTGGSQGTGKVIFDNKRPSRGYFDGKEAGYLMARREVAHWFDLHLNVSMKKPTKNAEKALAKFEKFIDLEADNE